MTVCTSLKVHARRMNSRAFHLLINFIIMPPCVIRLYHLLTFFWCLTRICKYCFEAFLLWFGDNHHVPSACLPSSPFAYWFCRRGFWQMVTFGQLLNRINFYAFRITDLSNPFVFRLCMFTMSSQFFRCKFTFTDKAWSRITLVTWGYILLILVITATARWLKLVSQSASSIHNYFHRG